jgi:hypothetical protein
MPIRIETQKAMQEAAKSLRFCYLCGQEFAGRAPTQVEHVVPRGLVSEAGPDKGLWPIALRVHPRCEERLKKAHDQELVILQRGNTSDPTRLGRQDRARMRKAIAKATLDGVPDGVPAIAAEGGFQSIWQMVRGMHASLYRSHLPADTNHRVLSPVPSFSSKSKLSMEEQIEWANSVTDKVLRGISAAIRADEWDGVSAWGKEVRYRCVWHVLPHDVPAPRSMCLWVLDTPQSLAWAELVVGRPVPWHGVYRLADPPPGATDLSDRAVDLENLFLEKQATKSAIQRLQRSAGRPRQ